jgi:dipeptide transport system ATP-binding protein
VDGIDVRVDKGEVLAIVGESGSGKSVSMLAAMGLLPDTAIVTADEMTFDGRDLLNMTPRSGARSSARDHDDLSGTHRLAEPVLHGRLSDRGGAALQRRLSRKAARARAIELFNQVGLPDPEGKLKSYPHQMSGGQSQRVMIAMAIATNPRLLIADEPTTALDVTIQKQILDLLMRLQEETGMALILITHDMGVVAETADRVQVQYKGKKMEEADVLSLFENPKNPYTRALLSALPENATGDRLPTVASFMDSEVSA